MSFTFRLSRFELALACVLVVLPLLIGCGSKRPRTARRPAPPPIEARGGGAGETSVPPDARAVWVETGLASWYGPPYHNRRGANGQVYDMYALTAAHRTVPLNSVVRVTNVTTGHSTLVRITDRGPFIEGRIIDLSLAAAQAVDVWRPGVARVRVEVLETPASIEHGGKWAVQIGAFEDAGEAARLRDKLARRYRTARVQQFSGPTGEWLRIRVTDDDRHRAQQLAQETHTDQGAVFLVRLD